MVQSKLHQNIQYVESHKVDEEEFGYESAAYDLDIRDKWYLTAIGKQRNDYSHYDVFYFPIYLVSAQNKIKAKIGVFEVEASKALAIYDEDNDIDLEKLDDPLIFNNITDVFLEKHGVPLTEETDVASMKDVEELSVEDLDEDLKVKDKKDDGSDDDDDNDDTMFSLQKDQDAEEKTDTVDTPSDKEKKHMAVDDAFIKESTIPSQITYPAETAEDAKRFVTEYKDKKATTDNWIQQTMKNKEFEILRNEGGGDCFFATLRDAYGQIGRTTTVPKLRKLLSQEVTQDMLDQYDMLYKGFVKEEDYMKSEMDKTKKMMGALKKQSTKASKDGQKDIVNEAKQLKAEYESMKNKLESTQEMLKEVGFMKSVENVDQMREYIQTSDFWADTWAISTLERLLNIKTIILESSDDESAMLKCGQLNDVEEMYANYDPQYYVLLAKTDEHYELVQYRKKKMLLFAEVPYAVKFKVVERCMEKNAGPYAIIPAFKQFQMDMGRKPVTSTKDDEGIPQEEEGLYENDVVFMYHRRSPHKRPGEGSGEKLRAPREKGKKTKRSERDTEFANLHKIEDWRQKLADTWTQAAFTIGSKKWSSVSHYLMALPFEEKYPDIFDEFSLNSGSELSRDVDKAKDSIEKRKKSDVGKHYEVYKTLDQIPDDVLREKRKEAQKAKFMNAPLTTLLNETKQAKLTIYRPQKEAEVDVDLMALRKEIQSL